jgi:hypothetical protein
VDDAPAEEIEEVLAEPVLETVVEEWGSFGGSQPKKKKKHSRASVFE